MKSFHLFFAISILSVLANKLMFKCCPSFLNNKIEGNVIGSKLISRAYNLSMKKMIIHFVSVGYCFNIVRSCITFAQHLH